MTNYIEDKRGLHAFIWIVVAVLVVVIIGVVAFSPRSSVTGNSVLGEWFSNLISGGSPASVTVQPQPEQQPSGKRSDVKPSSQIEGGSEIVLSENYGPVLLEKPDFPAKTYITIEGEEVSLGVIAFSEEMDQFLIDGVTRAKADELPNLDSVFYSTTDSGLTLTRKYEDYLELAQYGSGEWWPDKNYVTLLEEGTNTRRWVPGRDTIPATGVSRECYWQLRKRNADGTTDRATVVRTVTDAEGNCKLVGPDSPEFEDGEDMNENDFTAQVQNRHPTNTPPGQSRTVWIFKVKPGKPCAGKQIQITTGSSGLVTVTPGS